MRRLVRWVLMSMIFVCASIGVLAVIMLLTTTPEERASYSVTRTADAIAGNATGTAEAPTITMTPSATMTATITDTATIAPSDTPDLSSEITMSEVTTSTDNPFEGAFDNVPGIEIVVAQRASQYEEGGWFVYGEFIVAEDAQNTGTADALLTAAMAVDAPLSSVAFVLDDRYIATDYSVDAGDDEWKLTKRVFNLPHESLPSEVRSGTPFPDFVSLDSNNFNDIPGVIQRKDDPFAHFLNDEYWDVYASFIVARGMNSSDTASRILETAKAILPNAPIEALIYLDDGDQVISYTWDNYTDSWVILVSTIITPYTPEPMRVVATAAPVDTQIPRPGNCPTAVAMGLTAQQAAQWAHLDRDNDGVACYGD